MIRRLLALGAILALAGCEPPSDSPSRAVATAPVVTSVAFGPGTMPRGVPRSNIALAEDFLDLTFALERGERLRGLLRYEGPVRVYMRPGGLSAYADDLDNLLDRLRKEAGIDIARVADPGAAQIHVDGVTLQQLQTVDPGAACFLVPGETDWEGFRRKSPRNRLRWSQQTTLNQIAIFIPVDTFPQDVRDCLHEELAQALGPANDLYRLPDTVFNDDNYHSILTRFDMLMLRALYDPDLRSGMPREAVAARIIRILDRINPGGTGRGSLPRAPASAEWKSQIETALTRRSGPDARIRAAERAVSIARAMQPPDHRLGVALVTRGRLTRDTAPAAAAADFIEAHRLLRAQLGTDDIRTAQAALHVALVSLEGRDYDSAERLADQAIPVARRGQNAVLLSSLLAVKGAALTALGESDAARVAQLDHLRWARYAYGDGNGSRARAQAALEGLVSGVDPS
ncbi:DUF2927 domain-containing protein [Halovulum dunhuangense]|uniref:DUF2927 domain-containing protein n=1 Tax=Halovulum dunhuangense TaxID=1505036 RepID=A0A849L214_9RHOB|nr:DUF2927 domain-containing protein [Halovulum dunhuangense]NNU80267.1 DUF2927 domain-containing protein [Halovulum dunhuangense]